MRKFTLLCFLFVGSFTSLFSLKAHTQVTDSYFKMFLISRYPSCYNSSTDSLDLTCAAIANEDTLLIRNESGIFNLSGLEAFTSVVYLDISGTGDHLGTNLMVPALPPNLKTYICRNMGSGSPEFAGVSLFPLILPTTLERIDASSSNTTVINSALPPALKYLDVSRCPKLSSLPALPASLDTLKCSGNRSSVFDGVSHTYYGITALPALPASLKYLDCSGCRLSSLPALPSSLTYLNCSNNYSSDGPFSGITSMPPLPAGLTYLNCRSNLIVGFPALPPSLEYLDCGSNRIGQPLPTLPDNLTYLDFSFSSVSAVGLFPNKLREIRSYGNPLHVLPALPDSLVILLCHNNSLSSLPPLPPKLNILSCSGNSNLTCIPHLPASMGLPPSGASSNLSVGPEITCLPNHVPGMLFSSTGSNTTLPLCTPINNSNQCQTGPVIAGTIFYDHNSNGIRDAGENGRANVKVESSLGIVSFSNANGYFEIGGDTGANTISIVSPNPYSSIPPSASYSFSSYDTSVTGLYALQPGVITDSLVMSIVPQNIARPGFHMNYILNWENTGTTQFSTQMKIVYEDANLIYQNASVPGVTAAGGILTVPSFSTSPGDHGSITFEFVMRTTATLGDTMLTAASANFNGKVLRDSVYQLIRGSFDPNDKGATPILTSAQVSDGTFIDYLIRFQNTGTDTAFNVVVTDTLSNLLDASSFEMISTSHPSKNLRDGNKLLFEFINILLPDSNVNEPLSHGYIRFRIKTVSTLPLGSVVPNKANIYFDYNAPVITNVATTTVQDPIVCFTASTTSTPATCAGVNNGTITVTVSGGTAPFTYQLNAGASQVSPTFSSLASGNHTVIVEDANNCRDSIQVIVPAGPGLTVAATTSNADCGIQNGGIAVLVTGGVAPYSYVLDGAPPQSSPNFTNVASGVHRVIVTDAPGCSGLVDVTVSSAGSFSITVVTTPATCYGVDNGTATATPLGGTAPYSFSLNYGTQQASASFTNVPGGQNTIIVTDANNCTDSVQFNIAVGPGIIVTASVTPAVCAQHNGTITVAASNGTAPYSYGLNFTTTQSSPILTGIIPGSNYYTVSDAIGCSVTQSIQVNEVPITATITTTPSTCSAGGTIEITGSTGTPPFMYAINGGAMQPSSLFDNLIGGNYVVKVQDANMCTYTETVTVTVSPGTITPSVSIYSPSSTVCQGDFVVFTATPVNGGANPQYQWLVNGSNYGPSSPQLAISPMVSSDVSVQLISNDPCASSAAVTSNVISIIVTPSRGPEITITGVTTVPAGASSTITTSIVNGGSSPTYQWQDSTSTHPWANIPGATNAGIDYSPQQTGDALRAIMTTNVECAAMPYAYSNELVFTVESTIPRMSVYPNPVRSVLTIENNTQIQWANADIIDDNGRRLTTFRNTNASAEVRLDVSRLMSGVYFVRLTNRDGKPEYFKFIKQ